VRNVSWIAAVVLVVGLVAVAAAGPFFDMARTAAGEKTGQNDRIIAETIWFQGYLADKDTGDPIEGEHTVEIAILDAEVLGTEIWGPEAHDETIFSAGWFTVEMGIDQPLPSFDDPPYYLELSVDGEIFDPRIRMASVPFAFHANSSELDDADWAVDGNVMYPATAETVSIGSTDPLAPLYVETMGVGPGLGIMTPNGEGESAIYLAAGSDPDDMMLIDKFGSEMSPERDLSVLGKGVVLTGPSASGLLLGTMAGPIDFIVEGFGEPDRSFQAMHISEEGQVGIGTTLPDTTFHVMGTTKTLGFQMPTGASDGYVLKSDENGFGTWQMGGDSDGDWTVSGGTMYAATAETVVVGGTTGWTPLNVWGDGLLPNAFFSTTESMGTASILLSADENVASSLIIGQTGSTPEKGERQYGDPGKGFITTGASASGFQLISENGPIDFLVETEAGPARQTNAVRITEAGDVGIGTTTPDTTLHVAGGIKADAFQLPTGATDGYVLTSDASGIGTWQEDDDADADWTMSGGAMYPASADSVMVGTTDGLGPFTVAGNGILSQGNFYGGVDQDVSLFMFADMDFGNYLMSGVKAVGPLARGERQLASPGEAYITSGPGVFGLQVGAENGYIDFTLGTDGPARDIDAMRITADGEVGIGTTNPDTTLHVSGGIKADAFQLPTGASDGHILTSDAGGNASWQEPEAASSGIIIDKWLEGSTTSIGGTSWNQYDDAEVSVTVPGSGYVMVTSSVHVLLDHFSGTEDHLRVGHTDDLGDPPSSYSTFNHVIPSSYPSASEIDVGFTVSSMHEITSSGTYTYYLVGRMFSGQGFGDRFYYAETRAIYYPYTIPAMSAEQQHELELIEQKKALLNE